MATEIHKEYESLIETYLYQFCEEENIDYNLLIDDFTNHGIKFIEKNKENPFFLYLPFNTPHSPMQVPDKFWKKFEGKEN